MNQPYDEIRITRLASGFLSEYWFEGECKFKLFDSEGQVPLPQRVIGIMLSNMQRQKESVK